MWYLADYATDCPEKSDIPKREQFRQVIESYVCNYETSCAESEHYAQIPKCDSGSIWAS